LKFSAYLLAIRYRWCLYYFRTFLWVRNDFPKPQFKLLLLWPHLCQHYVVVPALIDKIGARSYLIIAYNFRIAPSFSLKFL